MKYSREEITNLLSDVGCSQDFTKLSFLSLGPCVGFCLAAIDSSSVEEALDRFLKFEYKIPAVDKSNEGLLCTYPGHAFVTDRKGSVLVNTGAPIGPLSGIPVPLNDKQLIRDICACLKFLCSDYFTPIYLLAYGIDKLEADKIKRLFYSMVTLKKKGLIHDSYGDCLEFKEPVDVSSGVFQIKVAHKESDGLSNSFIGNTVYYWQLEGGVKLIESPLYFPFGKYSSSNYFIKEVCLNEVAKSIISKR